MARRTRNSNRAGGIRLLLSVCAGFVCVSIWLLSVASIVEYRGMKNDTFLRGGRLFLVHYETKWKGHKGALQAGEKLLKESENELVIERCVCPHCGNPSAEKRAGQSCEQCGSTLRLETETIVWQPPGGFKFSYLGFARTYPYFMLSFDPRGMVRSHSAGWNLNVPTGVFVFLLPLVFLAGTKSRLLRPLPTAQGGPRDAAT